MKFIKWIKKKLHRKPKTILLNDEFRIVPAFTWRGTTYYMYEDPLNTVTGRGLSSLVHMEELLMRCNIEYLKNHTTAIDKILSSQKINVGTLARLNENLKERVNFLMILPDQLLKLASVVFFTKDESPFYYDAELNKKKIAKWSKDTDIYNFFLHQTRLKDLVPFLSLPEENSRTFLSIQQKIDTMHLKQLREILSKNQLMTGSLN